MEDAAELERLSKERRLDKAQQDSLIRIVGEDSSSPEKTQEKPDSPISTKKQASCL